MRSSAAIVLLALAGACSTRDVDTRPFRLRATRSATGGSLLDAFPTGRGFRGTGRVVDGSTLVIEGTTLAQGLDPEDVTVTFDRSASSAVAFSSARLDGKTLLVVIAADPSYTGPEGEPLPFYELIVATGTPPDLQHELVLVERVFPSERETEILPRNIGGFEDLPWFTAESDWAQFEPAECGLVYYDVVSVIGDDELFALRRGERREVGILPRIPDAPRDERAPWNVLHVLSWHREDACAGQAKAWTQVAAWR
jgi:hypothetical protein